MDKTYSPQKLEQDCYQQWENNNYFEPQGNGDPYCIMLPPPNVTGSLHMGHAFQHTLMDALVRYQRMIGLRTLWQPGTDHAGIATQLVVEKQLNNEDLSRKDMTRKEFIERIWLWKDKSGDYITKQMRRIGSSVAWSRQRFTMDEGFSDAVLKVFIQLYDEGLIYRGSRLVNWDPQLKTALSDLEVITHEEDGFLWHIRYPLDDSDDFLVIATTRPETLLGDTAVAVHPDDERFKHLIGKKLKLPLCDRVIPIIADTYVEKDFGSGCVKITPAHDFNDYQIGKRHQLPLINILTKRGTINKNAPIVYQGMDRFKAREQIIKDLKQADLLERIEPYKITIPRGEKSNSIIEPRLTDQWYVKTKPLAAAAIDAVKKGELRFIPESWNKTYFQWMENIEDWCISRQLWWGHQIPAWYDSYGHVFVGYNEADVRIKYKLDPEHHLKQDEDVLDTWFSAALWPFVSLGWPHKTDDYKQFYPTSVLITGFDILFFWVARMIMFGLKFTGLVPIKDVVITGLIRDNDGHKMSKSKGNVLDPIDIIDGISLPNLIKKRTENLLFSSTTEKIIESTTKEFPLGIEAFGTDALRFTFCSLASHTRNVRFDSQRVAGYRNFCNKLWNAARFVLLNSDEERIDFGDGPFQYSPSDLWILSRLQQTIIQSKTYFETYRFDLLANTLYDFVWHEYCDWYLELSKVVLYNPKSLSSMKRGTRNSLIHVLEEILKLLHPIIPFITECIWQRIAKLTSQNNESLMLCRYPETDVQQVNLTIEEEFNWVKAVIQTVRTIRSEMNIAPHKLVPLYLRNVTDLVKLRIDKYQETILALGKLTFIETIAANAIDPSASAMVGSLELLIPLNLIDKNTELLRLQKELAKLSKDILFAQTRLNDQTFKDKAPPEVISKTQEKLQQALLAQEKLNKSQKTIEKL